MARYTIKDLHKEVFFFNEYIIASSEYRIKVVPQYGCYFLYLQRKEETETTVRELFAGTARECRIYIQGLRACKWYFVNENELPY